MNAINNNNQTHPHKRKHFHAESILISGFIIAIAVFIFITVGNYYTQRADSRVTLQQGKAAFLAMKVVAAECYGQDAAFADQSGTGGFAGDIEEKIKELSGCPGELYLLQWDDKEHQVIRFCYVQDGYAATYEVNKNQEIQWNVFRIQSKM